MEHESSGEESLFRCGEQIHVLLPCNNTDKFTWCVVEWNNNDKCSIISSGQTSRKCASEGTSKQDGLVCSVNIEFWQILARSTSLSVTAWDTQKLSKQNKTETFTFRMLILREIPIYSRLQTQLDCLRTLIMIDWKCKIIEKVFKLFFFSLETEARVQKKSCRDTIVALSGNVNIVIGDNVSV